ncbi:uncharacterized protein LOC122791516 [Protopterus annectens]|uniref:uncharacterized protein LOC122791516 n=1 Tax=Protopterus annectens TaxID=7888 RepID=UPI001CFA18AF|nr:uncharacterized protein LOC122791516 [Protopterus annectens]
MVQWTIPIELIASRIIALKADNGCFWSVVNYSDRDNIQATKSSLDSSCKFLVLPASGGKVYIKTSQNKYLSRIHHGGIDYIEPVKDVPDVYCEFHLHHQDEKVLFMANNGKYLSRFHRSGIDNIEAGKEQVDKHCLFEVAEYQIKRIAQEMIAIKAENGNFWSVVSCSDRNNVKPAKASLDVFCQFSVFPASEGKVYIKTPHGKYLSRIHHNGIDFIEPAKSIPNVSCEFQLFIHDGKIFLKADNGKYLGRIQRGGVDNIEAAKEQTDEYCMFEVVEFKVAPFGVLDLFLNYYTPIAFRTDSGCYWSIVDVDVQDTDSCNSVKRLKAPHSAMTSSAKFFIEKGSSGSILLKTPQNKYLSHIHRNGIDYIEVTKDVPDVFCQFLVIQSYKMVLQADNGKYLSRIHRGSVDTIEAVKQDIDEFCYFDVVPFNK